MIIPFNKPYLTGCESDFILKAVASGKISGDGDFTKKCHSYFEQKYNFHKSLLTTSCTSALEMSAILLNISPGDELIMPSYTFVSTANAFVLRGAKIVFIDSEIDHPNMDADLIEFLITKKTKAIVVVHYAGVACNMDKIIDIARRHNLFIVEDAAQAIDSYYKGRPLGSLGHFGAFSFHETKNIMAGEGGLLTVNREEFVKRAEIVREKGTNRSAFFRGEIDKYGWIDIGSSFLPSDIIAAFLYAQLQNLDKIQKRRKKIYSTYLKNLSSLEEKGHILLPKIPDYATNNAHMFYIICDSLSERDKLVAYLKKKNIMSVFHYQSLHKSPYYKNKHDGRELPNSDRYSDKLLRLPLYFELSNDQVEFIASRIKKFYKK